MPEAASDPSFPAQRGLCMDCGTNSFSAGKNAAGAVEIPPRPRVIVPGLSGEGFDEACAVLDACRLGPMPEKRLPFPSFSPGGYYHGDIWQLDFSLALLGERWLSEKSAEQMFLNYESFQREDGWIPLYSASDRLPDAPHISKQKVGVSSLPRIFATGTALARRSLSPEFTLRCRRILDSCFRWWVDRRFDREIGLFSAVFEETFPPWPGRAGEWFPSDLNVELACACERMAELAENSGRHEEYEFYTAFRRDLVRAVNRRLWDDGRCAFAAWNRPEKCFGENIYVSTFAPLRGAVASAEHRSRLLALLLDETRFNWGRCPLTSADRLSPCFTIVRGHYNGNPAWEGDVWLPPDEVAVRGLIDSGFPGPAAQLLWKSLSIFDRKFDEFLTPDSGEGQGAKQYAWTAALWIDLLLGTLFGIEIGTSEAGSTVEIKPLIPPELEGKTAQLERLLLPDGRRLDVEISARATGCMIEAVCGGTVWRGVDHLVLS